MATLELPAEFGWVILTVFLSFIVHYVYMGAGVGAARKKYGVTYPALYADESKGAEGKAFNCVQRGHQNSLENQPIFLALLIVSGLGYPLTASISGVIWLAGRIGYFSGYSTGHPNGRYRGGFGYFGLFGLLGASIKFAVDLLLSK